MKAHVYGLGLILLCSACTAPSLRYKTDIHKLAAQGQFKEAAAKVAAKRSKNYSRQDWALAYLDEAVLLHDAGESVKSDELLSQAQDRMEDLYTVSATKTAGRFLVNDLTLPYSVAPFERAFTFFYRAMNFLAQDNLSDAAVEARRATAFLDSLRGSKDKGYNDDPFVQYFSSLIFESVGQLNDARICRVNALKGYQRLQSLLNVPVPSFSVPSNYHELTEVIIFHYNGVLPLKKSATIQFAADKVYGIIVADSESRRYEMEPELSNALRAGIWKAVTISYPVLEAQPFSIASSFALTEDGQRYKLQKMADLAAAAKADLEERTAGIWARTAARVIVKRAAAEATRQAVKSSVDKDEAFWGDLAGMFVNAMGSALEKADTRQWFTLPAQIFMTRIFLPPGEQDIQLMFVDKFGNVVAGHTFEKVLLKPGERVFLHYRTAQ